MLKKLNQHSEASQSVFLGSVKWLATMLAVIITFLLTPKLYGASIDWIIDYTNYHYGYGFDGLIAIIWGGILSLTIFFLSRATVSTGLVMGGLALASRMF